MIDRLSKFFDTRDRKQPIAAESGAPFLAKARHRPRWRTTSRATTVHGFQNASTFLEKQKDMELTSLTVLVDILDAGNLSQAARNLKMTRANVSYHLNQLEKSVGVQLVRRTTRRVEPTEVGLRLYAHGRAIQNEMLAARETITTLGQGLQGRVGLSVPSGYGQMVMSDWLIDFKRLYPGIVLDVRFENRVDDLIRDEVDIAIRVMPEPPPTLVGATWARCATRLCLARLRPGARPAHGAGGAAHRAGHYIGRGGQAAAPARLPGR
jgi:DNA-binding transcriptional LysR family regulator